MPRPAAISAERQAATTIAGRPATSFREQTDPIIRKQRLLEQARLRDEGDDEAPIVDDDFIEDTLFCN